MNFPERNRSFKPPKELKDYPVGTAFPAGHLVDTNAAWRSLRPVIDAIKCSNCLICWLLCPDGVIHRNSEGGLEIDYDFCKGCGICSKECRQKAIRMESEGE
ncbi:MAG: pyruvate ferredoxin oxidoreductase [Chlorobium sp.]|nr:MAG: pyruvate ferredoxin oxidoreductase [Chlorobium sp.]